MNGDMTGTPAPEKKPVKKRKSWGQQLPEPKTNLPPRKRAKTEDEKEQRRVERVLRNRRAAQSSRERKRQEVEALQEEKDAVERTNRDLMVQLHHMAEANARLQKELERIGGNRMKVFGSSSVASTPCRDVRQSPSPITFSKQLFPSGNDDNLPISTQSLVDTAVPATVNPASLSPEIRPVADASNASSSDMTQHPAAMLCDLQCQSEEQRPWMASTSTASTIHRILAMSLFISMTSEAISTLLMPLNQIINSLKMGSSLSPTPSIITLIIWLTTTTANLNPSISVTSSMKTNPRPRFSLRISLLRRLLACSPNLARPLMDATMVAMRRASEQLQLQACLSPADASRHGSKEPSIEALMTLCWAIHVIEKERSKTPKLDAAEGVEQALDASDLFRQGRKFSFVRHGTSSVGSGWNGGSGNSQESLEGWRTGVE